MFARNIWYVAAFPDELTDKPFRRYILGEPLAFFRTGSGRAVALRDSCPHRLLPLSMGSVAGEHIRCGYHGAEFSADGICQRVPGQDEIPDKANVTSYPVRERYGLVWIWMGDPALAAQVEPCAIYAFIEQGEWDALNGYLHIACGYQLVNDNLADVTHTQFVHPTTLGNRSASKLRSAGGSDQDCTTLSLEHRILDEGIQFRVKLCNTRMAPTFENAFIRVHGRQGWDSLDFQLDFVFRPPAFWIFAPTTMKVGAPPEEGLRFDSYIIATPETEFTSHYFYKTCQRYAPGKRSETQYWHEQTTVAFMEDKVVLEEQQKNLAGQDVHAHPVVSFRGDALGFQVRRFVRDLLQAETQAEDVTALGNRCNV